MLNPDFAPASMKNVVSVTIRNLGSLSLQPLSPSSDHPTYSGQNIFMCLLHVLGHFKQFKLFLIFFKKKVRKSKLGSRPLPPLVRQF